MHKGRILARCRSFTALDEAQVAQDQTRSARIAEDAVLLDVTDIETFEARPGQLVDADRDRAGVVQIDLRHFVRVGQDRLRMRIADHDAAGQVASPAQHDRLSGAGPGQGIAQGAIRLFETAPARAVDSILCDEYEWGSCNVDGDTVGQQALGRRAVSDLDLDRDRRLGRRGETQGAVAEIDRHAGGRHRRAAHGHRDNPKLIRKGATDDAQPRFIRQPRIGDAAHGGLAAQYAQRTSG